MQFKIIYSVYSCGNYDIVVPKTPPLPGAVLVENWELDMRERQWLKTKTPKAITDSNGSPLLIYEENRIEDLGESWSFGVPVKTFLSHGRNHKTTDTHYTRELPNHYWVIAIDTIEQLVELLKFESYFTIELDSNGLVIRIEH